MKYKQNKIVTTKHAKGGKVGKEDWKNKEGSCGQKERERKRWPHSVHLSSLSPIWDPDPGPALGLPEGAMQQRSNLSART